MRVEKRDFGTYAWLFFAVAVGMVDDAWRSGRPWPLVAAALGVALGVHCLRVWYRWRRQWSAFGRSR